MIVGIPIIQLTLFGYRDQHRSEAHAHRASSSPTTASSRARFVAAMTTSGYFAIVSELPDERRARAALARGRRPVRRHDSGRLHAQAAARRAAVDADRGRCRPTRRRPARRSRPRSRARRGGRAQGPHRPAGAARRRSRRRSTSRVHRLYNPESITQYNIVPGLMGVILTMTMVMMTGARDHARARARHDGEPARDAGRAARGDDRQDRARTSLIGLIQATIILLAARYMFDVPFVGSLVAAATSRRCCSSPCNLTVGITLSSLAQQPAAGDAAHVLLSSCPTILLSGFMFPFRGMPELGAGDRQRAAAHALQRGSCAASCSRATTGPTCGQASGR